MSLDALLEASPSLGATLRGARRAAESEAAVLILGEPGTGRSSLARALHDASPRAAGPLVEVDAAGIPTTLFESELFGYEPGAFTGAAESRPGRVAGARRGSLLLDQVEEIPLAVQPKLLRLLSEGRYAPLGGDEVEADVRFLTVGAADLPERVRQGAFRKDLFYRLEVVTFRLPPLRERKEDLPQLIDFFLADLTERLGRPGLRLARRARAWMCEHSWPGNLRELRNVIERAVILAGSGVITPAELHLPERRRASAPVAADAGGTLSENEERLVRDALEKAGGNKSKAARILGITRRALYGRLERYGIEAED